AGAHHFKAFVDVFELEDMRDHRIDLDLAVHVPVDDLGQFSAPTYAAKGRALPRAACDQLERARRNLGPRRCHADDDALAPALVRRFQRGAHDTDVTGRVKGVITAALGQLNQMRDQIAFDLIRVDEISHAKTRGHFDFARVDVDANDLIRTGEAQPLNDVEPNAS